MMKASLKASCRLDILLNGQVQWMSLEWIVVRRYFLEADKLLRLSDVEGFKGPDRLLHSAVS